MTLTLSIRYLRLYVGAVLDKVVGPDMIAVAPAPNEPKAVDVSEVCEALWIGVS